MEHEDIGARRPAPSYVTSITTEVEPAKVTARRVRRQRAHGILAMPGGGSKPWFNEPTRDLMRLLTVDPSVRSFKPRPGTIRLSIDGRVLEHTPDLRVERASETAIIDVINPRKRNEDADLPEAMRRHCARKGLHYSRITPEAIYRQPRFDNACELLRFKSVQPSPEFAFQVEDLLARTGGAATRGAIEDALGGRDLVLPGLYALVLRRVCAIDMGKRLSRESRVHMLAAGPTR